VPLKVIGAGMGRTGTTSLKMALEQLGFGPCYHMTELVRDAERWPLWEQLFEGKAVDWDALYAGYGSAVDTPTDTIYRALADHYPSAKVILTVRDPESWYRSVSTTVWSPAMQAMLASGPMASLFAKFLAYYAERWEVPFGSGRMPSHEQAIARFNAHNAEVERIIPRKRLLVYEVKEGWAPLCAFLEVPVPDALFPRENTSESFHDRVRAMQQQRPN